MEGSWPNEEPVPGDGAVDNIDEEDEDEEVERVQMGGEQDVVIMYDWGLLPEVCLLRVFWWLRDGDRVRANLACRSWHSVMRSPSLWRSRSFHLSGRLAELRRSEPHRAVIYVDCLGRYLKRLEVSVCRPQNSRVARRLQQTLIGLLGALARAGARLQSLSLTGLELDRSCWPRKVRRSLVRCLAQFLRREAPQLEYVSLERARTSLTQGLELLSALSLSQQHLYRRGRPGISSLDLDDFFSAPLFLHRHPTLPQVLHSLQGLTSLTLSYSSVSDELLLLLGGGWVREGATLRTLLLWCHVNEPHSQVVCGSSWASLANSCPELCVDLHVELVVNTDRLSRILLPEMPLTEYSYSLTSCYFSEQDWSAKPVLSTLLPQYRHRLEDLKLDLHNCHESLDDELVALVQMCVCLQYLKVWAFLDISTVEKLLLHRLEKRSNLNIIKVRIYSVQDETQEKEEQLEEMLSRYTHLTSDLHLSAIIHPIV